VHATEVGRFLESRTLCAAVKATFESLYALAAVLYAQLGEDGFHSSHVLAFWLIVNLHDAIFDERTYVANNGRIALVMG